MPICIIWKKTHPLKMHRHFTTGKTVQNWEFLVTHTLYIKPLTLLTFVALLVHFQTLFLMFFWICLKLPFQRGVTRLYLKKLIIWLFLMQVCGVLVARGRLKNSATKKLYVQKFFLSAMATFGKCTKKIKHFCKITSPLLIWVTTKNTFLLKINRAFLTIQ